MKCSHHPDKIFPDDVFCACSLLARRDQTVRANDALRKAVALLRSVTVAGMQMAGDSEILRLRKKVGNLHRAQKQLQRAHADTLRLLTAYRKSLEVSRVECSKFRAQNTAAKPLIADQIGPRSPSLMAAGGSQCL